MNRFDSKVSTEVIKKVHKMLVDVKTGEEIIDYLRESEPVFMKEVGRFVQIELDKLKKDFPDPSQEDFLIYIGSLLGTAYIMGFLIAREIDHTMYNKLIDFDSIIDRGISTEDNIDKAIDEGLSKTKHPKEHKINKIIINKVKDDVVDHMPKTPKIKNKKKTKRIDIDFDEKSL